MSRNVVHMNYTKSNSRRCSITDTASSQYSKHYVDIWKELCAVSNYEDEKSLAQENVKMVTIPKEEWEALQKAADTVTVPKEEVERLKKVEIDSLA